MKKTLLLVFVHGFQGDDDTFGDFPSHLQSIASHSLPHLTIVTRTYPRYETRGDLSVAVKNLRTWIQDTASSLDGSRDPIGNPSVRTIIICHSMGGIVAADVLLGIIDDAPNHRGMMYPYIQGIMAFDTPYLGLAPEIYTHSVNSKVETARDLVKQVGAIAGGLWGGLRASEEAESGSKDGMTTAVVGTGKVVVEEEEKERRRSSRHESDEKRRSSRHEGDEKRRSSRHEGDEKRRSSRHEGDEKRRSSRHEGDEKRRSSRHEGDEKRRSSRHEGDEKRRSSRHESDEKRRSSRPELDERKRSSRSEKGDGEEKRRSSRSEKGPSDERHRSSRSERSERPSSGSRAGSSTALITQSSATDATASAAPTAWQRWGKLAMITTAVGAFAAAGTAGYYKREELTQGFSWVTSHFEFVSELYKTETLKTRLSRASSIRGVGFANLYTSLGNRDKASGGLQNANGVLESFLGKERTFCSEPQQSSAKRGWHKMVNPKARDEIEAHVGMFGASTNPGFFHMRDRSRDLLVEWVEGWR